MVKKKEKKPLASSRAKQLKKSEKRLKIALFLAKFFLIFIIFSLIIENIDLSFLTGLIAGVAQSLTGIQAAGNRFFVGKSTFIVGNSCTGLMSAGILFSTIFALRKPSIGKKALVFLAGLVALLLLNIPRVTLVLLAAKGGLDAELIHIGTWFLMSAAVILLWYYGTKKIAGVKNFNELL